MDEEPQVTRSPARVATMALDDEGRPVGEWVEVGHLLDLSEHERLVEMNAGLYLDLTPLVQAWSGVSVAFEGAVASWAAFARAFGLPEPYRPLPWSRRRMAARRGRR